MSDRPFTVASISARIGDTTNAGSGATTTSRNTAVGTRANASGEGANNQAVGFEANASGNASGAPSNASGIGSSNAVYGNRATAFQNAAANFDNSAAIGAGVSTTRANQAAIGAATRTYTLAGVISAASAAAPAFAQAQPKPAQIDRNGTLILIRSTLLAVHQGNETGNDTVLRDFGSPAFQQRNAAARLAKIFSGPRNQKFDLWGVSVLDPQLTPPPQIEADGSMHLAGFFPSAPLQINFDLVVAGGPPAPPARVRQPERASKTSAKPESAKPPAARRAPSEKSAETKPAEGRPVDAKPAEPASRP